MKSGNFITILTVVLMVLLSACYYDKVLPVTADPVTRDVTFSGDIVPIFNASCNTSGCHNTGGVPPDLTASKAYGELTEQGLVNTSDPESSDLYQWMIGNESVPMPVSGSDPEYNALVLAWIQQGALNN